jgi:hypothetical protein
LEEAELAEPARSEGGRGERGVHEV